MRAHFEEHCDPRFLQEMRDRVMKLHGFANIAVPILRIEFFARFQCAIYRGNKRYLGGAGFQIFQRLHQTMPNRFHGFGVEGIVELQDAREFAGHCHGLH
jgi:hypothetical protein